MDASWFLKERTKFIRYYYDSCVEKFLRVKSDIESKRPPYDSAPYDESGEPPFLEEWMDADIAIELIGRSCVSILSETLKSYFRTLQDRVIGFNFSDAAKNNIKKNGFVSGYREALAEILDIDWDNCPISFDIIEQVVLARNISQHGAELTTMQVTHDSKTLRKFPRPFFAQASEIEMYAATYGESAYTLAPGLDISRDKLFFAISEIEKLADWVDLQKEKMHEWRYGKNNNNDEPQA